MRTWLRIAASAAFTAAAVFVLALWVRSHATFDRVSVPLAGRRTLVLISYRGSATAVVIPTMIDGVWRESGRSHPVGTRTPDQIWPRERVLGFGWIRNELYLNVPNSPAPPGYLSGLTGRSWGHGATGLILPAWSLIAVLAGLAALPWRRPRFSVRTMLIATTLVAVLCGVFVLASRAPKAPWENGVLVVE